MLASAVFMRGWDLGREAGWLTEQPFLVQHISLAKQENSWESGQDVTFFVAKVPSWQFYTRERYEGNP